MTLDDVGSWRRYFAQLGIEDEIKVAPVQNGRNEVVRAHLSSGRELLLKRGRKNSQDADGVLLPEGLAYLAFNELGLARFFPRCILHDRASDVLVLDWVGEESAREAWPIRDGAPKQWAALGLALAEIHSQSASPPSWTKRALGTFQDLVPSADALTAEELISFPTGQLKIVAAMQADARVLECLRTLRTSEPSTLIHGDLRLDNIVIAQDGSPRFVDLELSRAGDPLYDLGSLLGSILEHVAGESELPPGIRASALAEQMLIASAPALRGLIASYRARTRADSMEADNDEAFLSRTANYAGVHLLHRAAALTHQYCAETRLSRALTIVGCSFLQNPSYFLRPIGLDASHFWLRAGRQ